VGAWSPTLATHSGNSGAVLVVQEHVKREKQIMAECDCPFMVNLVASFKDATCLYMLQEAIMGGELFTYLQVRHSSGLGMVSLEPLQKALCGRGVGWSVTFNPLAR